MTIVDTLKGRWKPDWSSRPDLRKLSGHFNKTLSFIEALPTQKRDLAKPGNLSAKGLSESVRRVAAEKIVPDLRRAAWEAEKTNNAIRNERTKLAVQTPDKTDIAGALLRQEIRTFLRGMDHGTRLAAVIGDAAFLEAAMEGPAALSGLTDELRTDLQDRLIDQAHGPAIAALNEAHEAIELVEAAIEAAANVVRAECEFSSDTAFDGWMKTSSAAVEREIAAETKREEPKPAAVALTETPELRSLEDEFDKIFARGFPELYPDHPVNRAA